MHYRRLGSTGLQISRLVPRLRQLRRRWIGAGVLRDGRHRAAGRRADGPGVGRGHHRLRHGRRVRRRAQRVVHRRAGSRAKGSSVRDRLVLSSKVFNPVGPGPNERGLSRVHILRQIDASLSRLRTDRLDLYLMHDVDPHTPIEETLRALDDLRHAGKVHVFRRQQHHGVATRARARHERRSRARPLRVGAELVQPARSRGRSASSCRSAPTPALDSPPTARSPAAG